MSNKVKEVKRTGKVFSISGSEFEVTMEDGTIHILWSPPWHNMSEEEEEEKALQKAKEIHENGKIKSWK